MRRKDAGNIWHENTTAAQEGCFISDTFVMIQLALKRALIGFHTQANEHFFFSKQIRYKRNVAPTRLTSILGLFLLHQESCADFPL